ncbi:MAG: division/cell wall cluster transcriptional repressor MraZ [Oscillospiraceae bacterium]|nr:division/cell wall cluster transcriptional repressor MraZ [Oscillospiraceae bacterium]
MKPLTGTYSPSMDTKGRMAFPAKLREQLGAGFVVTVDIGVEGYLCVYSTAEFEKVVDRLSSVTGPAARQAVRRVMSGSEYPDCDKQGRIQIGQKLREYAGLDHDITVIGNRDHAEIWDTARYEAQNAKFSDEELAAALDGIAF